MRRPGRRRTALLIAVALVLTVVGPAMAGAPTDRVRQFFADVNRLIVAPTYDARPEERFVALRGLVTELVDFRRAAVIALGSEWAARSTKEREDFVRLFTTLLETSVFASIGARARIDNGLRVSYVAEAGDDRMATVATTVLARSGREMAVNYRMARRDGRWVVYDVVLDGVSLVENYRAQFHKVMQRSSYAELVSEMRSRTADLGRPAASETVATADPPVIEASTPAASPAPAAMTTTSTSVAMELVAAEYRSPISAVEVPGSPGIATPRRQVYIGAAIAQIPPTPVAQSRNGTVRMTDAAAATTPAATAQLTTALATPAQAMTAHVTTAQAATAQGTTAQLTTAQVATAQASTTAQVTSSHATTAQAATAQAATPKPATPRAGGLWVQVGAFRNVETAMKVVSALRDQAVSLLTAPNDPLLRVSVGPFASRDAAMSKLREIRGRGYDAFIAGQLK